MPRSYFISMYRPPVLVPTLLVLAALASGPAWAQPPSTQPATQPATQPSTRPAPGSTDDPYAGLDHTGTPPLPPREVGLPPPSARPGERRPVPDYDGRPEPRASAGEVLIWIPRVIFYPVHLVMEYGIRWPIVKAITLAEEHYLFERVKSWFTFADGRAGLFPTAFYDFGLEPSVGLYFYHNDLGVEHNNLVLQAGFWHTGWYNFIAKDSFRVFRDDSGTVRTRAQFTYRPDLVFSGLGPTPLANERFYRQRLTELEASLRGVLADLNRVDLGLLYRNVRITGGKETSIDEPFIMADPTVPVDDGGLTCRSELDPSVPICTLVAPGFGETYNLITTRVKLELDSRSPDRVFTPGSGLRMELMGSFSLDPSHVDLHFLRYGGEAAAFWDVSGINHVLALRFYVELLERTGDAAVPISERIILGGPEYLRGFLEGWFHGDSAMEITADYRYPIWTFLDANLFVSLGNVFAGRFERLHAKRLVMSWGFGIRSNTSRDVSFDFMVAFGTNQLQRWDEDFDLDNVRVLVGINQGF